MRSLTNWSWFLLVGLFSPITNAFAQEHAAAAAGGVSWGSPMSVGLGIAVAVFAAATAQGRVAAAFMEGVSRNPGAQKSMFAPLIIGLALIETLVLFTVLVCFLLLQKF